jgi:hypothetical protein
MTMPNVVFEKLADISQLAGSAMDSMRNLCASADQIATRSEELTELAAEAARIHVALYELQQKARTLRIEMETGQ